MKEIERFEKLKIRCLNSSRRIPSAKLDIGEVWCSFPAPGF